MGKDIKHVVRPQAPGRPATSDHEYERNGMANLFMMFEPLAGQRHVKVTGRRTAVDYAHAVRELVDVQTTRVVPWRKSLSTQKPL